MAAMHEERGITLVELMAVLAIATITLTVTVTFSLAWLGRQAVQSAVYDVQSHLQLARVQAITRNHACRFVIDESTGRIQLFDLNDPVNPMDDVRITDMMLPSSVRFSRPDAGPAITLSPLAGSRYEATFEPKGNVSSAVGEVVLEAGQGYYKVTLYRAGGVRVEKWNGTAWLKEL